LGGAVHFRVMEPLPEVATTFVGLPGAAAVVTGADGTASLEFTVPDSVTSWNVWVHAVTADMKGGSLHAEARTVKEIIAELREGKFANIAERSGREQDKEDCGGLETLRREGYM